MHTGAEECYICAPASQAVLGWEMGRTANLHPGRNCMQLGAVVSQLRLKIDSHLDSAPPPRMWVRYHVFEGVDCSGVSFSEKICSV